MRRESAVFLGVSLAVGLVFAQDPSQQPIFRSATDLVTIDVSVRRKNQPVTGLKAADFELFDTGVRQHVEVDTLENFPIDVSLVFDLNNSSQATMRTDFRQDLEKISGLLQPADRLRAIVFATDVREAFPMQSANTWLENQEASAKLKDATDLFRPNRQGNEGLDSRHDPKLRNWALFDALVLAMARPAEIGRRHVVIAFVLGRDSGGVLKDGLFFQSIVARTDALLHVAMWNRRYANTTSDALPLQYTRLALETAATLTGGDVHDANNVTSAFKSILADLRRCYVVRYTLAGVSPAGWHPVTVKLPQFPDAEVHARLGYVGR